MGCFPSTSRKQIPTSSEIVPVLEDPLTLVSETSFTLNEVEALFELYKSISSSLVKDGLINREEFQLALFQTPNTDNIFANRIFDMFDVKHKGIVDFGDFVRSLSVFHPKTPLEDKIDFSFKLYDLDGSGFIEHNEVKLMLVAVLSESETRLVDESIEIILHRTFLEADMNQDGKIDKSEWHSFVNKNPSLIKIMTLPDLKEITILFPGFIFHTQVEEISSNFLSCNISAAPFF